VQVVHLSSTASVVQLGEINWCGVAEKKVLNSRDKVELETCKDRTSLKAESVEIVDLCSSASVVQLGDRERCSVARVELLSKSAVTFELDETGDRTLLPPKAPLSPSKAPLSTMGPLQPSKSALPSKVPLSLSRFPLPSEAPLRKRSSTMESKIAIEENGAAKRPILKRTSSVSVGKALMAKRSSREMK
jgi:hypothetical protein